MEASPTMATTWLSRSGDGVGPGHADGGADGGAGVADGEEVVGRFGGGGEAADGAFLAEGGELSSPAGEQLVGVALVADVEEQAVGALGVGAEVVDVVEGEGELDDAEVAGEVAAVA